MEVHDLLTICLLAFFWVFLILTVLAIIMRAMTRLFPFRETTVDLPLYSSISATVPQILPGMKVTKIEEVK